MEHRERNSPSAREDSFVQRLLLTLAALVLSVGVWFLLGLWLPGGSERFYLLFPLAALVVYLAAVPDGKKHLQAQFVPMLVYVGILTLLCTIYNFYLAAMIVPDGSGQWFHGVQLTQILIPAYFFSAVSLLVILPLRLLRRGVCWLDERWFGPISEAQRGKLPRTLIREFMPALVTVPLLLPYFMGVVYVHRFKVPNSSNPQQVLHRPYEDVAFTTADGMHIRGWFMPAAQTSERTLVICHGLGANRSNFLSYCEVGDALHANVLMFDFRGHGDSDGHTVTFGYYERFDVLAALDYLRKERPEQAREVYGLGISMGSSALLQAAAEASPPFDGIIVDSAFASATELTDNILAEFPAALPVHGRVRRAAPVPPRGLLVTGRDPDRIGRPQPGAGAFHSRQGRLAVPGEPHGATAAGGARAQGGVPHGKRGAQQLTAKQEGVSRLREAAGRAAPLGGNGDDEDTVG